MSSENVPPLSNGSNGRSAGGRFAKGWQGGPGNPHASNVHKFRNALHASVTEDNIRNVVTKLVQLAEGGEAWAVKELLDRCLGKPKETVEVSGDPVKLWGRNAPVDEV